MAQPRFPARRRTAARTLGIALVVWLGLLALAEVASAGANPSELLPDLTPVPPHQLIVDNDDGKFWLGFASSAANIGDAELKMRGSRASTDAPLMRADQLVQLDDGSERVYEDAGVFVYVTEETHLHWHWQRFMRYELRHAANFKLANPDVKSGFCVADRAVVPGYEEPQLFPDPSWCEQDNPNATKLSVGLSVGWADPYDALLEGQAIEVTGLRAGRYYLLHHVNPDRLMRETDHSNNFSASLVKLTWPNGKTSPPQVRELVSCSLTGTPGRDVLPGPAHLRGLETGNTMCGLNGRDTLVLDEDGPTTALGGPRRDRFVALTSGLTLQGGTGTDWVSYAKQSVPYTIDLRKRTARSDDGKDALISIENATGGKRDDILRGTGRANELRGGPNHDTLSGLGGRDVLRGGGGHDRLNGGSSRDRLLSGPGDDLIVSRDRARDVVDCGPGNDLVFADRRDRVAANCEIVLLPS